jgi:ATP-binding cassette subfamily B protein/subfamily B ATP-binding cassette protein MsbA
VTSKPAPAPVRKPTLRLLRYAAAGWRGWLFIVVVTLASSLVALLQPWPLQIIIDHVLLPRPMAGPAAWASRSLPGAETPQGLLAWMVVAGLTIFALTSAADVFLVRAWVLVGQRMVYRLAADLFAHTQRRSLLFHSRNSVGDSLSRITGDSWCVYKVADTLLLTPTYALFLTAGMVVLMARMDLGLTLLAVAVAPFLAATSLVIGRRLRGLTRARREVESRIQSHVQRALSGVAVVQAFTQEGREHREFDDLARAALQAQRRSLLLGGLYNLVSGLILSLGMGGVLWLGARHVLSGQLSVGGLLVFLAYLASLQAQFKAFVTSYTAFQEVGASVDRVWEVLEADPEVPQRPGAPALPPVAGRVRLENVTFGYEPDRPVLRNVSLEVVPGQVVAIVGATGAGKTTLAGLITRFFDPWQGRVRIDGHDVRDVQVKSLRSQIGLVPQDPFLFPLTIGENIAFGRPGAAWEEIERAARDANLADFIASLPRGYETVVGERGATLSGGERQRLSIARALLRDAPILILDEPTSALDARTEKGLFEALQRLMKGRTTFIIAHRLSTIRNADLVVVLQQGAVVETGTHDELLDRGGIYARLVGSPSGHHPGPICQERSEEMRTGPLF